MEETYGQNSKMKNLFITIFYWFFSEVSYASFRYLNEDQILATTVG